MELSEIFYDIKSAKDKILDADKLRKQYDSSQRHRKVATLYLKLYKAQCSMYSF